MLDVLVAVVFVFFNKWCWELSFIVFLLLLLFFCPFLSVFVLDYPSSSSVYAKVWWTEAGCHEQLFPKRMPCGVLDKAYYQQMSVQSPGHGPSRWSTIDYNWISYFSLQCDLTLFCIFAINERQLLKELEKRSIDLILTLWMHWYSRKRSIRVIMCNMSVWYWRRIISSPEAEGYKTTS